MNGARGFGRVQRHAREFTPLTGRFRWWRVRFVKGGMPTLQIPDWEQYPDFQPQYAYSNIDLNTVSGLHLYDKHGVDQVPNAIDSPQLLDPDSSYKEFVTGFQAPYPPQSGQETEDILNYVFEHPVAIHSALMRVVKGAKDWVYECSHDGVSWREIAKGFIGPWHTLEGRNDEIFLEVTTEFWT